MSERKLLQAVSHSSDDVSPLFSLKSFVLGRHWAALGTGVPQNLRHRTEPGTGVPRIQGHWPGTGHSVPL